MESRERRLAVEQAFHDEQAAGRRRSLTREDLRFTDETYLDHETWIRPAIDQLGDVRGLRVLDLGSGHGMASVVLARRGARVVGLELSTGYLAEARDRSEVNEVAIDWVHADGERLPFADAAFDRVWCHAILHHLDLRAAGAELRRVLKPGGWAVACEPWGGNPLLRWARSAASYAEKHRTPDEKPLDRAGLSLLRREFPELTWQGHQLLGMLRRVWGQGRVTRILHRFDEELLAVAPVLRHGCRYVTLQLRKASV